MEFQGVSGWTLLSRDPPRCLTTDLTGTPLLIKPPKVPLFGLDVLFITTQIVLLTGRLLVPRLVRLIAPVSSPKSHWGRPRSACLVAKRHGDGSDPKQVYYYYECSYTASSPTLPHTPVPRSRGLQGTFDGIDTLRPSLPALVFTH